MSTGGQPWTSGVHRPSPRSRRPGFVSVRLLVIVGVVVALIAGSLGFFIGRRSHTDATTTAGSTSKTVPSTSSTVQTATTTAASLVPRATATVVVANGSGIKGAAGVVTATLKALGYATLAPANTTETTATLTSQVFAVAGSEIAAQQVIADLHLAVVATTLPVDAKLPILSAAIKGATVIVILGTDVAPTIMASTPTTVPALGSITAPSSPISAGSSTTASVAVSSAPTTIKP